jgi:hypothetical protein
MLNYDNTEAVLHSRPASVGARVLAGCVGLVTLGIATFITAGGALVAPIGMGLSRLVMRRQHRTPTFTSSWLGAVGAVCVGLLIGGGVLVARAPTGTFAAVQRSVDSSTAISREHPPEWLRRIAGPVPTTPQFGQRTNRAFAAWGAVVGALLGCVLVGSVVGTVGWGASLPLAYAITGRWPARKQVDADRA